MIRFLPQTWFERENNKEVLRVSANPQSPVVSIVLGSYNRYRFLKETIRSVRDNGISVPYEIIVIDGGSTDASLHWLFEQKDIITIVQHNRGTFMGEPIQRRSWGYFMNIAFKIAHGKYILMISDDCLLVPDAVMNGYTLFEQKISEGKKVGGVAFYWRNWPNQKDYWVGQSFGKMFINHGMYLKEALADVGWLEEENYFFYHADSDVSLKLWRAGYSIVDSTLSFIEHYPHVNNKIRDSNLDRQKVDWEHYLKKWDGVFEGSDKNNPGKWIYLKKENDCHFPGTFKGTIAQNYRKLLVRIVRKVKKLLALIIVNN